MSIYCKNWKECAWKTDKGWKDSTVPPQTKDAQFFTFSGPENQSTS
jgi:hypothetical protein